LLGVALPYALDANEEFLEILGKLLKKDPQMYDRVRKKMQEILETPDHFKPLSNVLKHYRRAHVGHFVIAFRIIEEQKMVRFVAYAHHIYTKEVSMNKSS